MAKLWLVACEELLFQLARWTFWMALALMLGSFAGLGVLPQLQAAAQDSPIADVETVFTETEFITVPTGFVDVGGIIAVVPDDQAANFVRYASEADAAAALQAGDLESFYVIAPDYLQSGSVTQYSLNPQLIAEADDVVQRVLRQNVLLSTGDTELAARVLDPATIVRRGPPPPVFSFVPPDLDTSRLASAGLVVGLFALLINLSGALLLRALQREAESHVLEVLIARVSPRELLGGKLLGLSVLTLGQAALALAVGLLVFGRLPGEGGAATLPPGALAVAVVYLLLGYLAFAGAVLCIAAIWPTLTESFQLRALLQLAALVPLMGVIFILPDAQSPVSVALSLFPVTSPLLMPFRLLVSNVPAGQLALGALLLAGWALLSVEASVRLFRAQSLLTGRVPTPRALWQALTA